jgi:hypothetical protein
MSISAWVLHVLNASLLLSRLAHNHLHLLLLFALICGTCSCSESLRQPQTLSINAFWHGVQSFIARRLERLIVFKFFETTRRGVAMAAEGSFCSLPKKSVLQSEDWWAVWLGGFVFLLGLGPIYGCRHAGLESSRCQSGPTS